MARVNNNPGVRWLSLLVVVLLLAGCASYQSRLAFEEAERLAAEEKYDQAVEKYFEAAQLEPASKTYKVKLIAARTQAAVAHIKQAREFSGQGKIEQALQEYRLARGLDPSLEIAAYEERQLLETLDAEQLADEGLGHYRNDQFAAAKAAARKAAMLSPSNPKVLKLAALLERRQHMVELDGVELDVASAEPLTLRFKNAKTKEVFSVLTKLTGINFIMDEDVRDQPISVFLEKASFLQALQLILQMNGLEKKVLNSKTIIIYPSSREKDKQYGDQIIQTFFLSHIDAKKAVNLLRTMLQLRKIYVHEERNALVIRDKPEVIRLAEQALNAVDRENSEVIFALELISVSDTDALDFGPSLSSYSISAGLSRDGTNIVSSSLGATTDRLVESMSNLETFYTLPSATFNFAKTLSGTQILASPKIRVRNSEKGKVHVGTREPIVTTTTTDGGTVSENITYVDVGIKVDIEPKIKLDNSVETKLTLEVSQAEQLPETNNGTIPLRIRTTNAQTVLTLQDGVQTIIGGLFSQDENSSRTTLPLFGEIPLLGHLLSSTNDRNTKQEILFSITPYIVKTVEVPGEDVATIWSGGEDNLKAGANFGAFAKPLTSDYESIKPRAVPGLRNLAAVELEADPDTIEVPEEARDIQVLEPAPPELAPAAEELVPPRVTDPASAGPGETILPEAGDTMQQETGTPSEAVRSSLDLIGPRAAELDQEFALEVQVSDINSLYSAPLFVNYDPVRLGVLAVEEGGFLEKSGQSAVFTSSVKPGAGQILVGYTQENGGQGSTGSGHLFTLRFKAQATGSALVELNRINFRDPQGSRLMVEPVAARIEIR